MSIPLLTTLLVIALIVEPIWIGAPLVFAFSLLFFRKILVMSLEKEKENVEGLRSNNSQLLLLMGVVVIFIAGFLIDALRVNHPGSTSLLLTLSGMVLVLYTRGFEMQHTRFFSVIFLMLTLGYAYVMGYNLVSTLAVLFVLVTLRVMIYLMQPKYEENRTRIW